MEFVTDVRYNKEIQTLFVYQKNERKGRCGEVIDIEHAKQEFERYLDEYDREGSG